MATNPATETLYLLDQDVYRLGSATSPKLDKVRPVDLVTYERNGILHGTLFSLPISDMPMDKYRGLLAELGLNCERTQKI
jgi:hypothetical protein